MDDDLPPLTTDSASVAAQRSLVEDARQLVSDARTLAEAELAFQTSRAKLAGGSIGKIAGLGALALALVFFALMALVFGSVFALAPYLTRWGATAAVTLALLLLALICGLIAKARWAKLASLLADKGDA